AELAGVPAAVGLTTAFAAMTAYAILGTSRHLKVTVSSTMAVMSAAVVAPIAAGDADRYLALTAGLALVVGVVLLAAGFARLGFISDFMARSVVTGFVFGLAITIIIGQLPKLLGVPGASGPIQIQLANLIEELPDTNLPTLAVGLLSIAAVLILRVATPRIPGPLVVLVGGIAVSSLLDLTAYGVTVVGALPTGLPGLAIPAVGAGDIPFLVAGALGIVFLAVGESLGSGRAFATRHGYEIDPDQELVALGGANISSGLFGGFTTDASLSQSATAESAGARSQLSSLLAAGLVLATSVFLAPLFTNLPNAVLAAIVVTGVLSLMDVGELRRFYAIRRTDFVVAITAIVGVVTTTVLIGLFIAVVLSLVSLLYRASRPYVAVLEELPGLPGTFADRSRHPDGRPVPGLLLLRLDVPLYFFNANVARTEILALVDHEVPRPTGLILDLGASGDLDTTTSDALDELIARLEEGRVELVLAQVKGPLRDRMRRSGLMNRLGEDHIYRTVTEAVSAWQAGHDRGPEHGPASD
ncbi:MAG TPA: SulP family inorganic anion transporter, partial [Patescibacteria group bacterium]|nr:SulP family inorganic anion transporter [Patescibacteria group bacterium]